MGWCSREIPADKRPHFFKVFFPCHSSRRLVIPAAFRKHIQVQHEASGCVCLRGPSGNVWNVDLVRDKDGGMALENGWEGFALDHSLRIGDFLVFRHDGGLRFTVLVFNPTACEKEGACHVVPSPEVTVLGETRPGKGAQGTAYSTENVATGKTPLMAHEAFAKEHASTEILMEEKPHMGDGGFITSDANVDSCTDHEPCAKSNGGRRRVSACDGGLHSRSTRRRSFRKKADNGALSVAPNSAPMLKQEGTTETEPGGSSVPSKSLRSRRKTRGNSRKPKRLLAVKQSAPKEKKTAKRRRCRRISRISDDSNIDSGRKVYWRSLESRGLAEYEKAKALEAAELLHPNRRLAISVMRPSYVCYGFFLYLPTRLNNHFPKHDVQVTLRGPCDGRWSVKYVYRETKRGFSGGWVKFARAHSLKNGDVCVFELLKRWEVRVHILRATKEDDATFSWRD